MPKLFGYLNQNNPMTIGDADAQIMYNCSIEHGWIEHKDYPVFTPYKLAVPNRYVKLPDGNEILIKPLDPARYGSSGILYGNTKLSDITIKAGSNGRQIFELRGTYFPVGSSLPDMKMFINGTETNSFLYNFSSVSYGYIIVNYNGSSVLNKDDQIEFRFDETSRREDYLGKSQKFVGDNTSINNIVSYSVDVVQPSIATSGKIAYPDTMSVAFGISVNNYLYPYKESTRHKFKNIVITINYLTDSSSEQQTRRLLPTEYTIVPHTYSDGQESGFANVIFVKSIREFLGAETPSVVDVHLDASYYPQLKKDDYVIENNGSDSPQEVFYAVTVTSNGIESAPVYETVSVGGDGSNSIYQVSFTPKWPTFSAFNYIYDSINIYRIPWGGNEYLKVKTLDSINDYSSTFVDNVNFFNQSEMLDTNGNTSILFNNNEISSIIFHKDMLFVAYGKLLYYSNTGDYYRFNAKNFLAFPDKVVDVVKHYSYLMVFTEKECYVLSGDDGNTFSVDNIDYRVDTDYDSDGNEETFTVNSVEYRKGSTVYNCAQSVYNKVITLVRNHKSLSGRTSVMLVNTRYAYDMTNKVRKFMDYMLPSYSGGSYAYADQYKDNVNRNRKLENKYYIAEFRKINGSSVELINLVYDALADGFILYKADAKDSKGNGYFVENNQNVYFKYRTKEFKTSYLVTPQAQYIKGIYVKGCGDFTVNIYGDGEIVSSVTYREPSGADRTALKIIINNVSNKRFSTLSVEFIGLSADAQIHDWEVYH